MNQNKQTYFIHTQLTHSPIVYLLFLDKSNDEGIERQNFRETGF